MKSLYFDIKKNTIEESLFFQTSIKIKYAITGERSRPSFKSRFYPGRQQKLSKKEVQEQALPSRLRRDPALKQALTRPRDLEKEHRENKRSRGRSQEAQADTHLSKRQRHLLSP